MRYDLLINGIKLLDKNNPDTSDNLPDMVTPQTRDHILLASMIADGSFIVICVLTAIVIIGIILLIILKKRKKKTK